VALPLLGHRIAPAKKPCEETAPNSHDSKIRSEYAPCAFLCLKEGLRAGRRGSC